MTTLSKMLNEELEYWREEEGKSKNPLEENGAVCQVLSIIDHTDEVTREWLLAVYKQIKNRRHETKLYELACASIARDRKRMEAIVRIGNKIKKMEI